MRAVRLRRLHHSAGKPHVKMYSCATFLVYSQGGAQLDELAQRAGNLLFTLSDAAAAVQSTTDAAGEAAKGNGGGFFGPLASLFESVLKVSCS
jgi:hypothetical protein